MSEQPFFPPVPMPPWAMLPFQRPPDYHGNEVPARVQLAIKFLEHLTNKEKTVSGLNFCVDGVELLPVEHQTQAAALKMLQAYFAGTLTPSGWEQWTGQSISGQSVHKCPVCDGAGKLGKMPCHSCHGNGFVGVKS